ncbi:MAG: EamA family transporter [Patescibacteria group bacterium]|nr:EamA family transporter [Patescibacteria group bacterium]
MWLFLTILAYFFSSIAATIDKFLISKKIPQSISYAFYIGTLSILALFLIFIGGLVWPTFEYFLLSLLTGALFILSLIFFFEALRINEASRIVPLVGSFLPIFSLLLSFIFLEEKLTTFSLIACFFLILGSFLMSLRFNAGKNYFIQGWVFIILASFLSALSFVLSKIIYLRLPFLSGFIWIRLGSFVFSLSLLLPKKIRSIICQSLKTTQPKTSLLFLINQGVAVLYFVLLNVAISLNSVSLVNALQGIQYVFIFFFALIISKKFPHLFQEELEKKVIFQKIIAIILIFIGLSFLAFFK